MSAELFESVVKKLCSEVHLETSRLNLYNWGEPTLNPDFLEILEIAIRYGFKIGISSNASFWVDIPQQILDYIESWVFSVSGFSQASYDRIHGFNVNTIYENIARYSNIFFSKPSRFRKNLTMAFHVYNFNKGEINDAKKFCMKHAINFYPYFAFLNDFDRAIGYLKTRQDKTILPQSLIDRIQEDLELGYVDDLLASQPFNYRCPQFDSIVIDEYGRLLTCCALPFYHESYSLGDFLAMNVDEVRKKKVSQSVCRECLSVGWAWWAHHVQCADSPANARWWRRLMQCLKK